MFFFLIDQIFCLQRTVSCMRRCQLLLAMNAIHIVEQKPPVAICQDSYLTKILKQIKTK